MNSVYTSTGYYYQAGQRVDMITSGYIIDTQAKIQLLNSNATKSSISGDLAVRNNLTAPTANLNSLLSSSATISNLYGPTGVFDKAYVSNLYGPTGVFDRATVNNLYGPTGVFDRAYISYLFSPNTSIQSLTGTNIYETNVNFTNVCKGPTGSFSNIDFGGLSMISNYKGSTGLSGCYTVGVEQTNLTQNTVPNFTFTSNSQNGYIVAASSIGRYSYPAYYAFNNGTYAWWSNQNAYNPDGSPSGSTFLTYNYGQSVSYGEWVSISCPNYIVLSNCTFINTDGFLQTLLSNRVLFSVSIIPVVLSYLEPSTVWEAQRHLLGLTRLQLTLLKPSTNSISRLPSAAINQVEV